MAGVASGAANYLINSGNLYRDLGRYEKGDSCYNRALELAMALSDRQIEIKCLTNIARSHTLTNIGVVHSRRGEYALALGRFEETLRLSEEIGLKNLI